MCKVLMFDPYATGVSHLINLIGLVTMAHIDWLVLSRILRRALETFTNLGSSRGDPAYPYHETWIDAVQDSSKALGLA